MMAVIIIFIFNFKPDFSNITIMSKLNLILRLLISLVLVVSVAGCAGGKNYESTGEYLDDSAITTKVKTSILANSKLKTLQISVETFKGVVQLSGFVDSSEASTKAANIARTVKGVKMVNNSLIVK
jgi:osmotically-inducible protein OsmY